MKTLLTQKIGFVSMLAIILTSACQKESANPKNQANLNESKSKNYNTTNKSGVDFSIYGQAHNEAMDYVASHPDFDSFSKQQVFNHLKTYNHTEFEFSSNLNYSDHLNGIAYTGSLFSDISNAGQKLYDDGYIDSSMISLAQDFFDVFDDAVPQNGSPQTSVSTFTASMEAFENDLKDNYTVVYDPETKEGNFPAQLLAAASVAKSSYAYWENVESSPSHPWHDRHEDRDGDDSSGNLLGGWFGKAWHSIKTAGVDVGGFFNGDCVSGCSGICWRPGCSWQSAGAASAAY